MLEQRGKNAGILGANSRVYAKRHRIQNFADHPVGSLEKGQDARNLAVALCINIERLVPKCFLQGAHPSGQLKKGTVGAAEDEPGPFRLARRIEPPDPHFGSHFGATWVRERERGEARIPHLWLPAWRL